MKKILLDTNFLMAWGQFKVDIFTQIDKISTFRYELFTLDKNLDELNKIIEIRMVCISSSMMMKADSHRPKTICPTG